MTPEPATYHRTSSAAFTLTELLVVVVILLAIAALAFPAYQRVQLSAASSENIANLKQIGIAYLLYAEDHNGAIPEGRSGSGAKAWFGNADAFDSPVRKLFGDSKWGKYARGSVDYLTSPDPLYSPLRKKETPREKGKFFEGSYGYLFMYSSAESPIVPGFVNERILYGSTMPICADFFGPAYNKEDFISKKYDQCAVLYLDGGVRLHPQAELDSNKRDFNKRFLYLINNR